MKVVIELSDKIYDTISYDEMPTNEQMKVIVQRIYEGTPLPKGHGRLGDLDKIWCKLKELEEYYQAEFLKESNAIHESAMNGRLYGFTNAKFMVQDAPTIIEADKAESEDKGVLEQLAEKQNNLSATNKAWSDVIKKDGYVN